MPPVLRLVASAQLVAVYICQSCGALVVDAELHRAWHAGPKGEQ